jgi:hypothetical protein
MGRAFSVSNVLDAKFKVLSFTGDWLKAVGCPERSGTWFIQGDIKNGKTSFAMMLAKYLTNFGRVAYDSVEEGLCKSIQDAYVRLNIKEVAGKFILLDKEEMPELTARLEKHKSPDFIFIDTVQFMDIKFADYKKLKKAFPDKVFIYLSHMDGGKPVGATALKIHRDASLAFRVEGFKAFPIGRYGGGEPITVCEKLANEYWGLKLNNN